MVTFNENKLTLFNCKSKFEYSIVTEVFLCVILDDFTSLIRILYAVDLQKAKYKIGRWLTGTSHGCKY